MTGSDRNDSLRAVHGVRLALKTLPDHQFWGGTKEPLVDRLSAFVVLGRGHVVCQHKQRPFGQQQFTSAPGIGKSCPRFAGRGVQHCHRIAVVQGDVDPVAGRHQPPSDLRRPAPKAT